MFPNTLFAVYVALIAIGIACVGWKLMTPYACVRAVAYTMLVWLIAALVAPLPHERHVAPVLGWIAVAVTVMLLLIGLADKLSDLWLERQSRGEHSHVPRVPLGAHVSKSPPALVKAADAVLLPPAELTLDDLYKDRKVIRFDGEIGGYGTSVFIASCVDAIQNGEKRVLVQVSTVGGIVAWGWQMHDQLRLLASQPDADVCVLVIGPCQSSGVPFIMAVPVEKRWATRNSRFEIHPCKSLTRNGQITDPEQLSPGVRVDLEHANSAWVIDLLARNTAIDRACLVEIVEGDHDVFFSAEEALEHGVIGGII
jgi:ATP-dependent protease ClpP protease subunit